MKLIEIHGVRGYIDENGTAQLNLEDVSRGLGFITVATSGNDVVRWQRVKSYLSDLKVSTEVSKDSFIPENIFYRLAMKAKNETAEIFQAKVADEILPTIRKTGSYSVQPQFRLPQNMVEAVECYLGELKKNVTLENENILLLQQTSHQEQQLTTQAPKVAMYDLAMTADSVQPVGTVAKELGLGRTRLFALLRDKKILRQNNEPYQEFIDRGYFKLRLYTITHKSSGLENKTQPMVTAKGMAWLHKIIKEGA